MQVDKSQQDKSKFIIDIQEVIDYNYCPVYYKIKYLGCGLKNITEIYDEKIKACFYSYLNSLKNNNIVDISYLTKLWGKYWIKDKSMIKLMAISSVARDRYDVLRKTGIDGIIAFYDMLKNDIQYPILINKGYSIDINDRIKLTGKWEYIREIHNPVNNMAEFQIIKIQTRKERFHTLMSMRHDLELTAASYAFNQLFNFNSMSLMYMNLYTKKKITSIRTNEDYEMLKTTVINTIKAINNNLYMFSPSDKCYHCIYRNQCEEYIKLEGKKL